MSQISEDQYWNHQVIPLFCFHQLIFLRDALDIPHWTHCVACIDVYVYTCILLQCFFSPFELFLLKLTPVPLFYKPLNLVLVCSWFLFFIQATLPHCLIKLVHVQCYKFPIKYLLFPEFFRSGFWYAKYLSHFSALAWGFIKRPFNFFVRTEEEGGSGLQKSKQRQTEGGGVIRRSESSHFKRFQQCITTAIT